MTVLDSVMIEEYQRKEQMKKAFSEEISQLEDGNLKQRLKDSLADIEFDQKKMLAYFEVAGINIGDYVKE